MRAFTVFASYLGLLIALGLAACGVARSEYVSVCYNDAQEEVPCCGPAGEKYACPPDAGDDADVDAGDDVDAGEEDGGPEAGTSCPGQCVTPGIGVWEHFPSFVWMGKETDPLPPPLPGTVRETWVDVTFAEPACPACSCATPSDACILPAAWNVESTACQDNTIPTITSFGAPAGWDGTCSPENALPAGLDCGGVPCAGSLVVEPPTLAPCVPEPAIPPEGQPLPPPVRTRVIEVASADFGNCDGFKACIPNTPAGYRLCIVADGLGAAHPCPDAWPERHTGWEQAEEGRHCSACTCGPVEGGSCTVRVKAYTDGACGNEQASMSLSSNGGTKCVDLLSGAAVGSKTAEILSYDAGACQPSGGDIVGETFTAWPVTYCCLAELTPPP
ncbi:hypothetical protein KEG38_20520 [Polyangium jinanense]|uniref:hypothetical protein n=1 Tax=Polyangium jinanense TaxID=2829994 RepID=UPI002340CF18|nr:hypothetical protein [Polyangium jinanense]MDC3956257.1 hypothetical protein [Polyangium jinanense]